MKEQPKKFIKPKATQKKQTKESPSISRSITVEQRGFWLRVSLIMTNWGVLAVSFLTGGLLMANVLLGVSVLDHAKELSAKEAIRYELLSEKAYWESVAVKYPDYKDAYFQLALRLYQLGEIDRAREVIEKVVSIDPQGQEARELLKKLTG